MAPASSPNAQPAASIPAVRGLGFAHPPDDQTTQRNDRPSCCPWVPDLQRTAAAARLVRDTRLCRRAACWIALHILSRSPDKRRRSRREDPGSRSKRAAAVGGLRFAHPPNPSCPRLSRASMSLGLGQMRRRGWPGRSPAMTEDGPGEFAEGITRRAPTSCRRITLRSSALRSDNAKK